MKIAVLTTTDIIICNAKIYKQSLIKKQVNCDILLVMPDFNIKNYTINTNIAIIYGDLGFKFFKNINYKEIITYGMSQKNTITISSTEMNCILIAIQREITKLNGEKIEIGEIAVEKTQKNQLDTLAISILDIVKK